jgi:hypothetical protein
MKYNVGDTVRIRSKEWMDQQVRSSYGGILAPEGFRYRLTESMLQYAGEVGKVFSQYPDGSYYLDMGGQSFHWEDWMLDPACDPDAPLSAEDAMRALLDGEALMDALGNEVRYDPDEICFFGGYKSYSFKPLAHLRRRALPSTRAMTRWEALAWASSEASHGWVVRERVNVWVPPQFYSYDADIDEYQRARLLPDGSGIDESSICGFEVEE